MDICSHDELKLKTVPYNQQLYYVWLNVVGMEVALRFVNVRFINRVPGGLRSILEAGTYTDNKLLDMPI